MSPDLSLDAEERLVSESVTKFCADRATEAVIKHATGRFDRALWQAFCAQGFFALGTSESDGGARMVAVCAEALGHAVFPGPVIDTFLAVQVLAEAERTRVIEGAWIVSSGVPPLLPFAFDANLLLGMGSQQVSRLEAQGKIEAVPSLGGEPWGRGEFVSVEALPHAERGLFFADVALAAYLTAAARGLLAKTAEHVATRKQFGRAVGSFQAVAHPLASCHISLSAARDLTRAAASAFDEDDARARMLATAALASARQAALETAYTCHQKLGAIGITLEGPAHHVTRRIRQLAARASYRLTCEPALLESLAGVA